MNCGQVTELLWDLDDGLLPPMEQEELAAHLGLCPECASEAAEIRRVKTALRNPSGIDVTARAGLVLAAAMNKAHRAGRLPLPSWRPRLAAGLAAAAALIIAFALFWPEGATALSISQLTEQHRICLLEGHHKNYRCHSEAEFAQLTANELGMAPRPFKTSRADFIRGDICSIGGNMVAHALLEVNGRTISFFRLAGSGERFISEEGWTALSSGIMWRRSEGHIILLRRLGDRDWGLYTGQAPLDDFKSLLSGGAGLP